MLHAEAANLAQEWLRKRKPTCKRRHAENATILLKAIVHANWESTIFQS